MNYGFYYGFNMGSSNECKIKSKEFTPFQNKIFNFQKKKKKKEKRKKKIISQNMYTFQSIVVYWIQLYLCRRLLN